jgi:hypothetical protein
VQSLSSVIFSRFEGKKPRNEKNYSLKTINHVDQRLESKKILALRMGPKTEEAEDISWKPKACYN